MTRPPQQRTLDRLVEAHLPTTMRFAIRLTGNRHEAEDVVAEALLRVARSWDEFRGEASFRTWLFRIVINVFRDRLKAERPAGGSSGRRFRERTSA